MALIDEVATLLSRQRIAFAVVGASALAAHGVSRATQDIDLLTTDVRVLDAATWTSLEPANTEIRRGDADDPLLGVVRLSAAGERDVDVIVGRSRWQQAIVHRAIPIRDPGLPFAEPADIILLKLYAGGTQDRWDIEQLLSAGDRALLIDTVEQRLADLPDRARRVWRETVAHPNAGS